MHNSGNIKKRLRNEGITKMRHQQAPTGTTIRGRHSPVLSSVGSSTVVAVVVPVVCHSVVACCCCCLCWERRGGVFLSLASSSSTDVGVRWVWVSFVPTQATPSCSYTVLHWSSIYAILQFAWGMRWLFVPSRALLPCTRLWTDSWFRGRIRPLPPFVQFEMDDDGDLKYRNTSPPSMPNGGTMWNFFA